MISPLRPTFAIGELPKMDADLLVKNLSGVRHYLYDLDQTTVPHYTSEFSPEAIEFFAAVAAHGISQTHISNANAARTPRAQELTANGNHQISEIIGRRYKLGLMTSHLASQELGLPIWLVGKPSPLIIMHTLSKFGYQRETSVMFGDLQARDIMAARLAGLPAAVLVQPHGEGDRYGFKDLEHSLQNVILSLKGRLPNGDGYRNGYQASNGNTHNGYKEANGHHLANGNGGR